METRGEFTAGLFPKRVHHRGSMQDSERSKLVGFSLFPAVKIRYGAPEMRGNPEDKRSPRRHSAEWQLGRGYHQWLNRMVRQHSFGPLLTLELYLNAGQVLELGLDGKGPYDGRTVDAQGPFVTCRFGIWMNV